MNDKKQTGPSTRELTPEEEKGIGGTLGLLADIYAPGSKGHPGELTPGKVMSLLLGLNPKLDKGVHSTDSGEKTTIRFQITINDVTLTAEAAEDPRAEDDAEVRMNMIKDLMTEVFGHLGAIVINCRPVWPYYIGKKLDETCQEANAEPEESDDTHKTEEGPEPAEKAETEGKTPSEEEGPGRADTPDNSEPHGRPGRPNHGPVEDKEPQD